tara:strand:- start:106366 stop:106773 length:408 start_codon:yes stop_codon:yes gene_type:complete
MRESPLSPLPSKTTEKQLLMTNFESTPRSSLRIYLDNCIGDSIDDQQCDQQSDQHADVIPMVRSDRQERELDRISGIAQPKTVTLTVGQIVPLLLDAMENDRTWLSDFADDSVRIDSDLYDVLLAYQRIIDRKAA